MHSVITVLLEKIRHKLDWRTIPTGLLAWGANTIAPHTTVAPILKLCSLCRIRNEPSPNFLEMSGDFALPILFLTIRLQTGT